MEKLFMIQALLNNLVESEIAQVDGEWWAIVRDDKVLFILCGDEGFIAEENGHQTLVESATHLRRLIKS